MPEIHLACQYFLNHLLDDDQLREHVQMLAKAGYQCIYGHSRNGLLTPYFSEAWFHAIEVILDECSRQGVKFAIWDEDGYPSPVAGGKVVAAHPEYAARQIEAEIFPIASHENFQKILDGEEPVLAAYAVYGDGVVENVTCHCGTVTNLWGAPRINCSAYTPQVKMGSPHRRRGVVYHQQSILFTPEKSGKVVIIRLSGKCGVHKVDILNANAVKYFLQITHEEYFRRFGKYFGELIVATFMDEPATGCRVPWTDKFPETYREMWDQELMEVLPHLFTDIDGSSALIRHRFRMTQHQMLCHNYLEQVQKWCADHGIQSVGHLSRTEYLQYCNGVLWPDELRCCKYLDIPCTDPLGFNIAWRDTASYSTGIKVVSSAAKLFGKAQAGSDALAVMGNEAKLRDFRFQLDFQMILGLTYFNIHGLSYSLDGPRKDEVPPALFYQNSEWEMMPVLLERTRFLAEKLSASPTECHTAMLYSASTFYCRLNETLDPMEERIHLTVDDLLSHQKDFDFIDEETLREFSPEALAEKYPFFVVPPTRFVTRETAEFLRKYPGKIFVLENNPQIVEGGHLDFALSDIDTVLAALPGEKLEGENYQDIFIRKQLDGTVCFFNRSKVEFKGFFNGQAIVLPPGAATLLEEALAVPPENSASVLSGNWQISVEENHLPLAYPSWSSPEGAVIYYDLIRREIAENAGSFSFVFNCQGAISKVMLVLEEHTIKDMVSCSVNGHKVEKFTPCCRFDCLNFEADITEFIRTSSTPAKNVLTIESTVPVTEMPRLYGKFTAEFPHCSNGMPTLTGSDLQFSALPGDLRQLGLPSFSGKSVWQKKFTHAGGKVTIDLGRVEDAAIVRVDGVLIGKVISAPYRVACMELSAGEHTLTVEVFNASANREDLAGIPAGLYGPVQLF